MSSGTIETAPPVGFSLKYDMGHTLKATTRFRDYFLVGMDADLTLPQRFNL